VANSHIPFNYNYNISSTNINPNLNNFAGNQYISSPMMNQNNNVNLNQGNNINQQISQTQVRPQNYPGDIEIHRRPADTDESCLHQ